MPSGYSILLGIFNLQRRVLVETKSTIWPATINFALKRKKAMALDVTWETPTSFNRIINKSFFC